MILITVILSIFQFFPLQKVLSPFQLNAILILVSCFLFSETPHVDQRYPGSSPILFYRPRRSPDSQGKNHDDINSESRCSDLLFSSILTSLSPFSSFITSLTYTALHSSLSPLSSLFLSLPLMHTTHPIPLLSSLTAPYLSYSSLTLKGACCL